MHSIVPGFLTSISLIAAIGAQNAMVLRHGIARSHVADVAQMASSTGAKAAGFADRGTIAVGKRADLLLCDDGPARNPAPRDGRAPTPPTVITAGKRKER